MNEVIHNRTVVHLDWLDRFRVLVGKPIHIEVDIEIAQPEVLVVGTTSRTWVENIIPRRHSGGYAQITSEKGSR